MAVLRNGFWRSVENFQKSGRHGISALAKKPYGEGATLHLKHSPRKRLPCHSTNSSQNKSIFPAAVVLRYLPSLLLIRACCLLGNPHPAAVPDAERVIAIVNELRAQLQIGQQVHVTIAAANDRILSVERIQQADSVAAFNMTFDEAFLANLDEEELKAAIAHELGHVWIFSHHPYLHTETLANEIAMRVVSRESLKKLYRKLWAYLGVGSTIEEFLGPEKSP